MQEPLERYLHDAASGEPTPGGGSVAALAGALACTMAQMAANFTTGKKKYQAVEAEVQERLAGLQAARDELGALMQRDTEAYGQVSAAYGLPKDTPEQKQARTAAIQDALVVAMAAPLDAVRACARALEATARLADVANPNLISDVGVAAVLGEAALRAARLNVDVNLAYLKDDGLVAATRQETGQLAAKAAELAKQTMTKVNQALGIEGG